MHKLSKFVPYLFKTIASNSLAAILVLLAGLCSNAQTICAPEYLPSNYFGQAQGLLQLNVKSMEIDNLGFLWVGTEDGLHRFNGYEFKSYVHDPNDSSSIKDDHIRSLHFSKNILWIASNSQGILGFDLVRDKFFAPIENDKNRDLKTAYRVLRVNQDTLLFSTKNNLIFYKTGTQEYSIIPLQETLKENFVSDLLHIDSTYCWVATSSSGIMVLDKKTNRFAPNKRLEKYTINSFFKTEDEIFVGTEEGLFTYNINSKKIQKSTFDVPVNCFYEKNKNEFYIGTDVGLFSYNCEESEFTPYILQTNKAGLNKKMDINQIIGDKKGNLWIGTEGDGLYHLNRYQKKFETIKLALKEYPLTENISSFQFLKGEDSTLWIGTKLGIVKYNFINQEFKQYSSTDQMLIYTIVKDEFGTIWAGGFTSGLLKYEPELDQFVQVENDKNTLPDKDVIEIIPIDSNTLWVCTWSGGIQKFDIEKKEFEEILINKKRLNRARTSLTDREGNIWLGTDQGAFKIEPSLQVIHYSAEDSPEQKLNGDRVFDIKEDDKGNIWIATNVGLTKLDILQNKTTLYYKQKGLPNDFIYSILIDDLNKLWVGTNYGISVLDTETNTFKNYTTSDGLQNNEFNGKASYRDKSGNFYFGGMSGINIFRPENIYENQVLPNVYIESVELFNKAINQNELYKDTLYFKNNENVLTLNFSALNYLNPEKCNYTYMMEGFDPDWRPLTKNRSTTYTNLNPGEYIFKVKASNDAGKWNESYESKVIIIVPPWYLTTFFKITFIVLFLLSGIIFYSYQTQKLKKDKLKLEYIVAERTKDIVSKNKDLGIAFKEAEKQRDSIKFLMKEITHRVKNNLQIISSLLNIQANNTSNKKVTDALKMAKNRILTLAHIENKLTSENDNIQIDTFIKDLSESIIEALSDDEGLKYKVIYDLQSIQIKNFNTTLTGLILNELITNTTKYAFDEFKPENELAIICKTENNTLKLVVKDNGKGYSKEKNKQSKTLGIELIAEMINQLDGTIKTNSQNGTENRIHIPF